MKIPKAFEIVELVRAARECASGVRWKQTVCDFMNNVIERCICLQHRLMTGTYILKDYSYFKVYEPKVRQISSQSFEDRIVQRSLCNNGVYEDLTRSLIYDNCACIKDRGSSFAVGRLKCHMQHYFRKYGLNGYVIHVDIRRYFPNISHGDVRRIVWSKIKEPVYRNELYRVIDSFSKIPVGRCFTRDPEVVGIPLGSQLSQLFALNVLDLIDRFIKERLRIKYYIRYMDDLILLSYESYDECRMMLRRIVAQIEAMGFEVNKKTMITPFIRGIRFMKRKFVVTKTGRIISTIDHSKMSKERRKLRAMLRLISRKGKFTINDILLHYQGWRQYILSCENYGVVSNMDEYFRYLLKQRPDLCQFVHINKFDGIDPRILEKFIV